jgi:hypothetical protein
MPQGPGDCPWWCHTAFGPGQRHWNLENLAIQIQKDAADYRLPESSQTALEICEAAFLSNKYRCQVHFPRQWHLSREYALRIHFW